MSKTVTLEKLAYFKTKQDAANEAKFMQLNDFVDGEGKIKSEKFSVEGGTEVIKMHVDSSDPENIKYFADNNGVASETEITGEVGKIYIDLESGGKIIYTYGGENFIPFVSGVATDEDINSLFE